MFNIKRTFKWCIISVETSPLLKFKSNSRFVDLFYDLHINCYTRKKQKTH